MKKLSVSVKARVSRVLENELGEAREVRTRVPFSIHQLFILARCFQVVFITSVLGWENMV